MYLRYTDNSQSTKSVKGKATERKNDNKSKRDRHENIVLNAKPITLRVEKRTMEAIAG